MDSLIAFSHRYFVFSHSPRRLENKLWDGACICKFVFVFPRVSGLFRFRLYLFPFARCCCYFDVFVSMYYCLLALVCICSRLHIVFLCSLVLVCICSSTYFLIIGYGFTCNACIWLYLFTMIGFICFCDAFTSIVFTCAGRLLMVASASLHLYFIVFA